MHLWQLLGERADTRSRKLYHMVQEQTSHDGAFARPLQQGWILEITTNPNSTINMYAYESAQALSLGKFVESAEDYEIDNLTSLVREGLAQPYSNRANESVINELFNKPASYQMHQISDDMVVAGFTVGALKYISYFARGSMAGKPFWDFTFEFAEADDGRESNSDSAIDNTGLGSEFIVFATVLNIMKEFINTHKPEVLKFSGAKAGGGGRERGRSKLYRIMATKLQTQIAGMGYSMSRQDVSQGSYFTMTRNSVEEGIFGSKKPPAVPADRLRHASMSTADRRAGDEWMGKSFAARTKDEDKPKQDAVYREPRPRTFGKRGA